MRGRFWLPGARSAERNYAPALSHAGEHSHPGCAATAMENRAVSRSGLTPARWLIQKRGQPLRRIAWDLSPLSEGPQRNCGLSRRAARRESRCSVVGCVGQAPADDSPLAPDRRALGIVIVVVAADRPDPACLPPRAGLAAQRPADAQPSRHPGPHAWLHARGVSYSPPPFAERGLYRRVRRPLMTGFVVIFWSAPTMTAGHVLFAAAATCYILVGIAFEEHDLIRSLGDTYRDYRARVPSLIPRPLPRRSRGARQ